MITGLTKFIFFASIASILYVYIGYPLLVLMISKIRPRPVSKKPITPSVTILIAAYNEAECIAGTIENKLALDYPKEKIEIIVISDGSTDGTDEIVRRYENSGVRLIRQVPRAGKTSALNLAVPHAKGEIIVFSDANSTYAPDTLKFLVENFNDPGVGYVTGKMIYTNPDGSPVGDGCSAYMKYENLLRDAETQAGSVVGVDGGIDAARKSLYQPMKHDQLPDFVLPLRVVEQGYRVIYEPRALLQEQTLGKAADEYRMRVRVCLRALWAIWDLKGLLNPVRYRLFSFQILSHKVLRYHCFVFMVLCFISNCILLNENICFKFTLGCQVAVYIVPFIARKGYQPKLLVLAKYFILVNMASMTALAKFMRGHKQSVWQPRKG